MKKSTMLTFTAGLFIGASSLALAGSDCGSCSYGDKSMASKSAKMDIVATAASTDDFSTLVAAVKAAGLAETLQADGPYTVFAPTNEAFAKLPAGTVENLLKPENKDQLQAILTYHVIPAKVMAKDVTAGEAPTANGDTVEISIKNGLVMIDGATVTQTDIVASNGVIHVIDTVIMPDSPKEG